MPRQTREKIQATRDKVLLGALDVFSKKGFSRSTLEDIAKHIHMTRGVVYWHFKDKQDLMIELMRMMAHREVDLISAKVSEINTVDDIVNNYMARLELLDEDATIRKFAYLIFLQVEWATEKKLAALPKRVPGRESPFAQIREALLRLRENGEIRDDVDVDQLFGVLMSLFTGIMRAHLSGCAHAPTRETLRMGLEAIVNSIRPH
jgi:AcrR family transcriptional regulator